MTDINQDIYCNTNQLNPSFFPVGSAAFQNRNFDMLPFLCDLLKNAGNESINPVLVPPKEFDITPYTDFSPLTAIGDPRVSLGHTLSATFVNFLPRIITQTEVMQNGGTQVIDNYICNGDGTPIKQSATVPILLSLDLTGQKPYKWGAVTVPPISATFEQLMQKITGPEVIDFTLNYIKQGKMDDANAFVDFINKYFISNGWQVSSLIGDKAPVCLIVKLTDNIGDVVYLKYYNDTSSQVSDLLNVSINSNNPDTYSNNAIIIAAGKLIPNYSQLMQNPDEAQNYYNSIISSSMNNSSNFVNFASTDYNSLTALGASKFPDLFKNLLNK